MHVAEACTGETATQLVSVPAVQLQRSGLKSATTTTVPLVEHHTAEKAFSNVHASATKTDDPVLQRTSQTAAVCFSKLLPLLQAVHVSTNE
jgi:hypothetical protein